MQRDVAGKVPEDGWMVEEDGRWAKEARRGAGQQHQIGRIMRKSFLLSFMSFESPMVFHSLADLAFAIPRTILVHDNFLVHDSVVNGETMDVCLPLETVSQKRLAAYLCTFCGGRSRT